MHSIGIISVSIVLLFGSGVKSGNEPQPDCPNGFMQNGFLNETPSEEVGPLASKMNVYIEYQQGPAGTYMCAKCWSGNHNKDTCRCATPGRTELLHWEFTAGSTTKFWCQTSWGNGRWQRQARIDTFAVFGDGVPKKSSDWRINAAGKVRFQEDGKPTDDYKALWIGTKP